jgi:conjugal transfer pilus assembly protein TrbC
MGEGPLFTVFASLSMPQARLSALIRDTTKAGGVVVFRGFPHGSTKAFAEGLKRVVTDQARKPTSRSTRACFAPSRSRPRRPSW